MPVQSDSYLLRVFLGEDDRAGGRPLYETIVLKALEMLGNCLVTLEPVQVLRYGPETPAPD